MEDRMESHGMPGIFRISFAFKEDSMAITRNHDHTAKGAEECEHVYVSNVTLRF